MLRRPSIRSTLTTLAAAAVLVGGADLASYAATGNAFILGHANSAGTTTALKNTGRGPALSLNSARNVSPLVVNSKKLVKNFNANMVGGLTAGQLNPPSLTYKIGHSGGTLSNAQHLFKIPAPVGLYRISVSGLWSASSTDSIQCLAVDKTVFQSMDISLIYLLTFTSAADTDNTQILGSGFANLKKGHKLVIGCSTEGDTGSNTIIQPITFTFDKVTQKVKKGTPITITARNAGSRALLHR